MTQWEQAIEAIAKRFSASWEKGANPPEAYLSVSGERVGVDIAVLKVRPTGNTGAAKPRLRFDKGVTRLMNRLRASFAETVPDGTTVLLTVTAPIRQWSRTAALLEAKIQPLLARRSRQVDKKATILSNRIHIRILRGEFPQAPKLIGFVHNPETNPLLLLNMASESLEMMSAQARKPPRKPAPHRWLILISPAGSFLSEAYRHIYSEFGVATTFKKTFLVFADAHVEPLSG